MARIWTRVFCFLVCALLPCFASADEVVSAQDYDFGPFLSRDVSLDGSVRIKAFGPFWERRTGDDGSSFTAARPVYSRLAETNSPRILKEVVWPVGTFKIFRNQSYWRVLTGFGNDYDLNEESRYKNRILPILFQGKAADGSNYFAFFPVGGTIKEFMGKDRISFALFPLYARTQINEFVTHDVLWPFVSWGKHDEGSRWRVFPLYGQAQHDGHWKKRFVMWPIWTSVSYEKTGDGGFILFPVTGYSRIDKEKTYWLMPPFVKWLESPDRRVVNCPWPFLQYETGLQEKLYLWPLWGTRKKGAITKSFYLWPIFSRGEVVIGDRRDVRFRALPFVFADKTVEGKADAEGEENVSRRYFKLWPLMSYRREGDVSRLRSLELWPIKHSGPIERNFAPLWTIYSREKAGDSYDTELLWGIYRNRKGKSGERAFSVFPLFSKKRKADADEFSSWNILAGLFGREVEDGVRRWRVLYFLRFGNKKVSEE